MDATSEQNEIRSLLVQLGAAAGGAAGRALRPHVASRAVAAKLDQVAGALCRMLEPAATVAAGGLAEATRHLGGVLVLLQDAGESGVALAEQLDVTMRALGAIVERRTAEWASRAQPQSEAPAAPASEPSGFRWGDVSLELQPSNRGTRLALLPEPAEPDDDKPRREKPPVPAPPAHRMRVRLLEEYLELLAQLWTTRHELFVGGEASWRMQQDLERGMVTAAESMAWMGGRTSAELARVVGGDEEPPERVFAAALGLFAMVGSEPAAAVFARWKVLSVEAAAAVVDAALMSTHPEIPSWVSALLAEPLAPAQLDPLLPLAFAHGRLSSEDLQRALSPQPVGAGSQALRLAWRVRGGPGLRSWLKMVPPDAPWRPAACFASAITGDPTALQEVRDVVAALVPDGCSLWSDALAACGTSADTGALAALARGGAAPMVHVALRALGRLGDDAALPLLDELVAQEDFQAEARQAKARIAGSSGRPSATGRRLLLGQPWTVARAFELLADEDATSDERRFCAAEIVARTGQAVWFDEQAPVSVQRARLLEWRRAMRDVHTPEGAWMQGGRRA